jgi:trehalose 6-phosphate phosphatase
MENLDQVERLFREHRTGLMADLDGTLSEMVVRPDEARVSPEVRRALRLLSAKLPAVAVITGRSARDGLSMVQVEELTYIGNHGMERIEKGHYSVVDVFKPFLPELRRATDTLNASLKTPGMWLEDKRVSISIHYRHCQDQEQAHRDIVAAIDSLPNRDKFIVIEGKMVVNFVPAVGSDKGTAVKEVVKEHRLGGGVFMGDDVTDLDGFRAIRELRQSGGFAGLNVAVLGSDANSQVRELGDYTLAGVGEVSTFLDWLATEL